MKLPMSWLKEYVDIDYDIKDYCHRMTMTGSKVEGYETICGDIDNVVIGQIKKIEKHPDADKLVICQIDIGNEVTQIVTGAKNVFEGAKVPVSLPGAHLAGGVKISKGKLRGVDSYGMLCSEEEIGININGEKCTGIMILEDDAKVGADFIEYYKLKEDVVEFEITSNRPDCLGIIGLARETAATYGTKLNLKEAKINGNNEDIKDYIKVTVENKDITRRYMAKVVKNVKIGPSPLWMQRRLNRAGVRAINNIVDITNYVMLEYGQPMHAFDIDLVEGKEIIVRNAKPGETIITLDGEERKLDESILVIADKNKANAVAGVMGGEKSGVNENTNTIVFESANFDGASVRKAAQKIGLRTESSARFEKDIDKNLCPRALNRALELIELLGIGEVVGGVIDINTPEEERLHLPLEVDRINKFLGINATKEEMINILKSLEFEVENDLITAPTVRRDIGCFNDIAEEIVRIYGYDAIPSTSVNGASTDGGYAGNGSTIEAIRSFLADIGCYEVYTYAFTNPKMFEMLRIPEDSKLRDVVKIKNPLGVENSIMKTTTIHSLLEVMRTNYNKRNKDALIFEISRIYVKNEDDNKLPEEPKKITIAGYGDIDFFSMKGIVSELCNKFKVSGISFKPLNDNPTFHPYRCANIYDNKGNKLGIMGEIHPLVLKNYEIGEKTYVAELDLNTFIDNMDNNVTYKKMPKFPATTRDLAMLCDDDIMVSDLEDIISKKGGKILENIELFDVYKGEQIPENKKSVAYSLSFRATDRTLTDDEVQNAMDKILKGLAEIGAELR